MSPSSSPSSPLRIAILGSTYPRSTDDPAVPWQRESVRRTVAAGHTVTVVAPSYRGLKNHQIDGVDVRRFRYAPAHLETLTHDEGAPAKTGSLLFKLLAIPYLICGLVYMLQLTARKRFDVIHVHWPFPHGLMAWLPARLFGAKIVSTCHGAELAMARNSRPIRLLLAWCLNRSDAVSANSSHTAAEIGKISSAEVNVLPYGATVAHHNSTEAESSGEQDTVPMLLFCGRLIQRKGIDILIRALPKVLAEREVRVVITGTGDRKLEWEALTREVGVAQHVNFVGFVSNEELAELYSRCSVYVHPAIFDDNGDTEGLGVVLIEAMSHRKPVVASAVGGIVDVIKHEETGLLVPERDEPALGSAILRVLDDPSLAERLGEQGFEFARQHFDWNRIIAASCEVYRQTVGAPRPFGSGRAESSNLPAGA